MGAEETDHEKAVARFGDERRDCDRGVCRACAAGPRPERASAEPATRSGPGAAAGSRACRWRRSVCEQRGARDADVPARRAGRQGQQRAGTWRRRAPSIRGRSIPATWKYGTAFDAPAGSKIWNPVKLKMMQGGKVTGGTLFSATDPATYCAMANAGYDFIWTEMQHDQRDWENGRAHVAHLPAREGRARRARRLHRRARDPARARRRRARHRRADRRHRGRGDRGAQLDLLPAARPAQQRRRPGVRRRRCGAACPAAIATRSTTTSC